LSVALLCACHHKEASAPPNVVVALPIHADADATRGGAVRYPIEVAARYSNTMSFRVPGKIMERRVRIGDSVKKGEVVAELDPIDAQKKAASAQAALDGAVARLLHARQTVERDRAQAAENLIAARQLEQSEDEYAAARAAQESARDELVVARNNLEYNTLRADHDGVITSENADTGQVVAAGQPVYGLAWNGDVDAVLDAAANDLGRISAGQPATVTLTSLPGLKLKARVREIAPAADPQSRTYRVKLTLLQPGPDVRLGMTGDAVLAAAPAAPSEAPPSTFKVPATAIFHQANSPAVWVVDARSSTLQLRPVTVRSYGDHFALVDAGLKDGETVVLAGVHAVHGGELVSTVRPLFDEEGEVAGPAGSGAPLMASSAPAGAAGARP
jgi:RND family efflux transporter MFP subunit